MNYFESLKSHYFSEDNQFKDGAKKEILDLFLNSSSSNFTTGEVYIVTQSDLDPDTKFKIYFEAIKKNKDAIVSFIMFNFNVFVDSNIKRADKEKIILCIIDNNKEYWIQTINMNFNTFIMSNFDPKFKQTVIFNTLKSNTLNLQNTSHFEKFIDKVWLSFLKISDFDSEAKGKIALELFTLKPERISIFYNSGYISFLKSNVDPQVKEKVTLAILKIYPYARHTLLLNHVDDFFQSDISSDGKKKILKETIKDFPIFIKNFFLKKILDSDITDKGVLLDKLFDYFQTQGGTYNDIKDFLGRDRDELFRYELLETQNTAQKLGLEVYSYGYNSNGSAYLEFYKDNQPMFIIRVSNHNLQQGNSLPAGVINTYAETFPLTKEDISDYYQEYNTYSEEVKKHMWENRYISSQISDFDWINEAESN